MTGSDMDKPIVYNEMDDVDSDYDPRVELHNEATLRQMLAFDIAPDPLLVDNPEALDLNRSSQDVFEAEMLASQQRRNNIGPMLPLLLMLTRLSSEVANAVIVEMADEDEEVTLTTPESLLSASIGIIATLVDLGVLAIGDPAIGALA